MNPALFSSSSEEWATPAAFFAALHAEFGFTLDACATPENAKCERFYSKADNALAQDWTGVVFMNPPYGRQIGEWMHKAWVSAARGATVVCLVPSRTDTRWWHEYVEPRAWGAVTCEVRFIKGRLKFGGAKSGAPFPSAVIIYRPVQITDSKDAK